ncbi:hypothetical protein GH742_05340 [Legionella sp. MW5194]|uniref:hypothetical protein n=1 Tax=Legionella sp. MW5194 TaxID=2662448 RepID=UPI00193EB0B2|nr:hypothetical protein [Legionella sp. MW5194]QRN03334.1 hypothetical protein GH742_05340 [Legionella sp. MW5194]
MPKSLNHEDFPAVNRIKHLHQVRKQVVDFGEIIGQRGPSFFHPEISRVKFNDRQFENLSDADLAPLPAPGSAGC